MFKRAILAITATAAIMLCFLLFVTTPSSTGPVGILGFFVFMYLTALGVLTFLFRGVNILISKRTFLKQMKATPKELSLQKSYYYASVVALAPVMLVAMQSVASIGIYQILLVLFFIIIGWLYVSNRTA